MLFCSCNAVLVVFLVFLGVEGQRYHQRCPQLYPKLFKGYIPRGNLTAGKFTKAEGLQSIDQCVMSCCDSESVCNVALLNDGACYHIDCASNEACLPVPSSKPEASKHVTMALVLPVTDDSWWEVMTENSYDEPKFNNRDMLKHLLNDYEESERECEVGLDNLCALNEVCVQVIAKSRAGLCKCKEGFVRTTDDDSCHHQYHRKLDDDFVASQLSDRVLPVNETKETSTPNMKQLTVSVRNKEVRLPENEVTMNAYVVPVVADGQKYQYEWTLLKQPPGNPIKKQNEAILHLSKLSEGLYTFKVSVSSTDAYGVTFANVTVLPPQRINRPPQVIINPASQTIKLPNTGAVLDASGTKDDDGIVSWHWELQQGPLGYQPHLVDMPTLQLANLDIPGNYVFKVTVTDTDHASNASTANITVLKITDYPPEANAGQDQIIYLPRNNITLNGNLSRDDRAIVTWEWTKSPSDADKAADMQDTRTPYLRLSDLEEGMYTFTLKVTDSAGQSSAAQVHVFVMPPTNRPPVAEAGANATISLPQQWAGLDGSASTDDNRIVGYAWQAVDGPPGAVIRPANASVANATGLTKGRYVFRLTVTDDSGNVASDLVHVTVNQNKNEKPKANAGGDQNIVMPVSVIFINGSRSHDDLAVTRWKWQRDPTSLAIGRTVPSTEEGPVLMVTDVVGGRYVFQLTVWDEQGLSDTDTVSVMVKEDPRLRELVELTVEVDADSMTQSQYEMLQAKLALLVSERQGTSLRVRELRSEAGTGRAVLVFYVEGQADATQVVGQLRQKLTLDEMLLGFSVVAVQTTVCQNNCSGHGVCNEQTRRCLCEAFWMQDLLRLYAGDGGADCDWSVLYVVVGLLCGALALAALCWGCVWICLGLCSKRRLRRKPQTYSLLGDTDEPVYVGGSKGGGALSESDTDSDVLFESRNNVLRSAINKANRNGFIKLGRRVKT